MPARRNEWHARERIAVAQTAQQFHPIFHQRGIIPFFDKHSYVYFEHGRSTRSRESTLGITRTRMRSPPHVRDVGAALLGNLTSPLFLPLLPPPFHLRLTSSAIAGDRMFPVAIIGTALLPKILQLGEKSQRRKRTNEGQRGRERGRDKSLANLSKNNSGYLRRATRDALYSSSF